MRGYAPDYMVFAWEHQHKRNFDHHPDIGSFRESLPFFCQIDGQESERTLIYTAFTLTIVHWKGVDMILAKKVHLFLAPQQSYQDPRVRPNQSPADTFSPVVGINRFLRTYPDTRKRDDRGCSINTLHLGDSIVGEGQTVAGTYTRAAGFV